MTAKRVIIIVALAALLIGVAYVRALFSHQEYGGTMPAKTSGRPAKFLSPRDVAAMRDSVRVYCIDSLNRIYYPHAGAQASEAAPLGAESLRQQIRVLTEKLGQSDSQLADLRDGQAERFEKLVAAFYANESSALPNDLSSYERTVSIREIKTKAMKYFDLSSDSLNEILAKRK